MHPCRPVARGGGRNHAHGLVDVALFEQGRVFAAPAPMEVRPLPDEPRACRGRALRHPVRRAPVEPDRARDVYDAVDVCAL